MDSNRIESNASKTKAKADRISEPVSLLQASSTAPNVASAAAAAAAVDSSRPPNNKLRLFHCSASSLVACLFAYWAAAIEPSEQAECGGGRCKSSAKWLPKCTHIHTHRNALIRAASETGESSQVEYPVRPIC